MKTKNIPKILLALSFVLILSCSKTEENTPIINIDSLVLTTDSPDQLLVVNEILNFILTGDDGNVYTDQATFYVSQTAIIGSSFTFNEEGSIDVYASYGGINSNVVNFNVINATSNTLITSDSKVLRNQELTLSLVDPQGNDVSSTATFYVDNIAISGNTYSSSSIGTKSIYAEYDLAGTLTQTDSQSIEIYIPKRKIVIEDYTGAWCGNCPPAILAADEIHNVTEHVAVVAIHSTSFTFTDPMHYDDLPILVDALSIGGAPEMRMNRNDIWLEPYETSDVTSIAGADTDIAIAINSQVTGADLVVGVKVISENGLAAGDKLVVYLVEDRIIHDQANYLNTVVGSPFFGLGDPIPDFEHNHVLRESLSLVLGDNMPATAALTEYTRSFTTSIPSDYVRDNLSLVVMVVNDDNSAKNSQFSHVGDNKDYE